LAAQIANTDELAANYDWASNAEHLVTVGLAALLAGVRRPGAQALAVMAAAVLVFLGAAATTVPADPGSWGLVGGAAAIATGAIMFVAAASVRWRGRVSVPAAT
jgi:hypothetical protein